MTDAKNNNATPDSTTGSGAPAPSDRHSLTVGPNGPLLLHDVHFLEQMAHFNREKVPERQPHAKGAATPVGSTFFLIMKMSALFRE